MVLRATLIVFCVALNFAGLGDFACCPAWNLSIGVDWCPRHYWIYICLLSLPMSMYTVFWSILMMISMGFLIADSLYFYIWKRINHSNIYLFHHFIFLLGWYFGNKLNWRETTQRGTLLRRPPISSGSLSLPSLQVLQ